MSSWNFWKGWMDEDTLSLAMRPSFCLFETWKRGAFWTVKTKMVAAIWVISCLVKRREVGPYLCIIILGTCAGGCLVRGCWQWDLSIYLSIYFVLTPSIASL
jgi:hypothetical protein